MIKTVTRDRLIKRLSKITKHNVSTRKQALITGLKKLGDGYRKEYINLGDNATKLAKTLATGKGSISLEPETGSKPLIDKLPDAVRAVLRKGTRTKKLKQAGGTLPIISSNTVDTGILSQGPIIDPIDLLSHKNYFENKINTKPNSLLWGLGVEHEMQIFHLGTTKQNKGRTALEMHKQQAVLPYGRANIMFDSQESTCFITGDNHKEGACCKSVPGGCSYSPDALSKSQIFNKTDKLTPEELEFLLSLDWEATGRYAKGCRNSTTIVDRVPVLMPELVTSNFKNRTINSIAAESVFQEEMFIKCQMKNPFTREKVKIYGPLVTHKCGTIGNIKIPMRPTFIEAEYELEEGDWKDYVGSYHITITLPHAKNITGPDFVKLHQDCANQIQWLEPLLMTAFFSPDPEAMGIGPERGIEGSFRVGAVGWGNFAGTDIRKFGTEGATRGANLKSSWRKGLKLMGMDRLNECVETAPPQYKKSINILTGDFRTFNMEPDYTKCKELYNPNDCPKADGGIMSPPYGMEIRIFDHFHSEYLLDLLKIIILCAANGQRHPATEYVYENKAWIKAQRAIMTRGWNAVLGRDYITLLREQLGLELKGLGSLVAFDVFGSIITELHTLNKSSMLVGLLDETPDVMPRLPSINRECWELAFNGAHMDVLLKYLTKHTGGRKVYGFTGFKKLLFGPESPFSQERWGHQADDICYALESRGRVKIIKNAETGGISTVRFK